MKNRTYLHAIVVALFGMSATTPPSAAQQLGQQDKNRHHRYQLVDLGTLGGPNSYLTGGFYEGIATQSLSAAGMFAGAADTAIPDPYDVCFNEDCMVGHAVQWRDGSLIDLGTLPGAGDLSSAST